MTYKWLGLAVLALCVYGCGGTENTNTLEVRTEPSVASVTLRFTDALPEGVDEVRLAGFTEAPEEEEQPELIQVYGPETQPASGELVFSDVPTNVVEVEIDLLDGDAVQATSHVSIELTAGGNIILEDPPFGEAD